MGMSSISCRFETACAEEGYRFICGVDEAGAGPLMGPVFAAAVILPSEEIEGLNDSKKLSEKRREALYEKIIVSAVAYAVASASAAEIDAINIRNARMLAMQRAIEKLPVCSDFALIDGNCAPTLAIPYRTVVQGDALCASIAAASILAKVSRDRHVTDVIAKQYPQYLFEKHKGYGTKLHYEMLDRYGSCPEHRESFLVKWRAKQCGQKNGDI